MNKKQFIQNFNFPEPNWSTLPERFPNIDKSGLTKEEGHLLDGIKLAWLTSEGKRVFYKTFARRAIAGITIIVLIVLFGKNLATSTDKSITRTASAKTVTQVVEDFVAATMSAVFRK